MTRDLDWFFIPADADDGGESLNLAARTITLSKANALIREYIETLPKIYGSRTPQGVIGYRWYTKPWGGRLGRTTHQARLVDVTEKPWGKGGGK